MGMMWNYLKEFLTLLDRVFLNMIMFIFIYSVLCIESLETFPLKHKTDKNFSFTWIIFTVAQKMIANSLSSEIKIKNYNYRREKYANLCIYV